MRGVNYRGRTFYAMAPGRPEQQALGMQRSHPRQPLDPTPPPPHTHVPSPIHTQRPQTQGPHLKSIREHPRAPTAQQPATRPAANNHRRPHRKGRQKRHQPTDRPHWENVPAQPGRSLCEVLGIAHTHIHIPPTSSFPYPLPPAPSLCK